jgi:hypothetical protein
MDQEFLDYMSNKISEGDHGALICLSALNLYMGDYTRSLIHCDWESFLRTRPVKENIWKAIRAGQYLRERKREECSDG